MNIGDRPLFTLTFRPEPGVDAVKAVRALLKAALRRYGLKCINADEKIETVLAHSPPTLAWQSSAANFAR